MRSVRGISCCMLIETNGPGGHYSALGRYCILGEPSEEMCRYWDMAVRAQQNAARAYEAGQEPFGRSQTQTKYFTCKTAVLKQMSRIIYTVWVFSMGSSRI